MLCSEFFALGDCRLELKTQRLLCSFLCMFFSLMLSKLIKKFPERLKGVYSRCIMTGPFVQYLRMNQKRYLTVTLLCTDVFAFSSLGEWQIKYNRAIREIDFTKKKLQQEFEDKLESEQQSKRHLERKARNLE